MKLIYKNLLALTASIIVIAFAFWILADDIVSYSLYDEYEEIETSELSPETKVYRNDYGIPEIFAANDKDLFIMTGYCQAQDRMWQMDILRRKAYGNMSEIFGKEYIKYDKFIRCINLKSIAENLYKNLDRESKNALENYSKGVNLYLERFSKKLPFEFSNLEYIPEKWTPIHSLAIQRLFALQLSYGFKSDLLMGNIAAVLGKEKANMLVPDYPKYSPYIYEQAPIYKKPVDTIANIQPAVNNAPTASMDNSSIEELNKVYNIIGAAKQSVGSNAWVINKPKNGKRNSVLANDSHLELVNPVQWYQLKMISPNYNVVGLALVGTPLISIGRNSNIAWGMANSMADEFDYYYENLNPKDLMQFLNKDSVYKRFTYTKDTIKVKNENDYIYFRRASDRSFIISDFALENKRQPNPIYQPVNNPNSTNYYEKYCVSFRWAGQFLSNETSGLINIMKAKSLDRFKRGAALCKSPSINFIYADAGGNIASFIAGAIPIRTNTNPLEASFPINGKQIWKGFIDNSTLPSIYNPECSYIIAANNKLFHTNQTFISNYWDNPSRAERIDSLLKQVFYYSARDAQIMQYDLLSPYSKEVLKICLPLIEVKYSKLNLTEKRAFERLKAWENIISTEYPSSLIYNQFVNELKKNIFYDDLGFLYNEYIDISNYSSIKLLEVLRDEKSPFIPSYQNKNIVTLNDLVNVSFSSAIELLKKKYGEKVIEWNYGIEHYLDVKHIFAKFPFLSSSFSLEQIPIGGNGTTINNFDYEPSSPFKVKIGASARFITDMKEKAIYFSIPGGAVGDIYSPHYNDQYQLWIHGGYIKMSVSKKQPEKKPSIIIKS